jgi:hypothetical protein
MDGRSKTDSSAFSKIYNGRQGISAGQAVFVFWLPIVSCQPFQSSHSPSICDLAFCVPSRFGHIPLDILGLMNVQATRFTPKEANLRRVIRNLHLPGAPPNP